jgi:hypothetical protein
MKLENVDGFTFNFIDAVNAFVFDEKDKSKATFHGQPMKAVDILVELADAYLFIEIKNFEDAQAYDERKFSDDDDSKKKHDNFKWLKNYLKYKYRDSYLFRHAEEMVDKPIHYICLLNFDNALNSIMEKKLKQELPIGKASRRWRRELVASCQVVNLEKWNRNFPKWPVLYIAGGAV